MDFLLVCFPSLSQSFYLCVISNLGNRLENPLQTHRGHCGRKKHLTAGGLGARSSVPSEHRVSAVSPEGAGLPCPGDKGWSPALHPAPGALCPRPQQRAPQHYCDSADPRCGIFQARLLSESDLQKQLLNWTFFCCTFHCQHRQSAAPVRECSPVSAPQ